MPTGGVKFKRQQPIERYIVDLVAFAPKLIVELDGSQHMKADPMTRKGMPALVKMDSLF